MNERFVAIGVNTHIILGPVSGTPPEIEIAWEDGATSCRATSRVERLWWELREIVVSNSKERSEKLALDPNRYVEGLTVALAKGSEEAGFEIWYVEGIEELYEAGDLVSRVLDSCRVDVRFKLPPKVVYPEGGG